MDPVPIFRAFIVACVVLAAQPAFAEPTWITCTLTRMHLQGGGTSSLGYALNFAFDDAARTLSIVEDSGDQRACEVMNINAGAMMGTCFDSPRRRGIMVSIRRGTGRIELNPMNGRQVVNFPWEEGTCEPRREPAPSRKF
jgi:hypothetical protein